MALYGGGDRSKLTHSHSVKTGLLDIPEAVLDGVGSYLGNEVEITGLRRKEDMEIPVLALREAIVNAICHRDYSMQGAVNKIEVFSDRVEIVSPGTLPTGIAPDDLGQGISEVRNAQIVKIFRKTGYIEQLGTGIIRMRQACGKAGLSEPRFQEVGNFFKVTFPRRKTILPQELKEVVALLSDQGGLGSSQIAMRLKIHQNTALKRLKKLQDLGFVRKKGRGAGVSYDVNV
jgi:ATP-dependent DNA helicase RecG